MADWKAEFIHALKTSEQLHAEKLAEQQRLHGEMVEQLRDARDQAASLFEEAANEVQKRNARDHVSYSASGISIDGQRIELTLDTTTPSLTLTSFNGSAAQLIVRNGQLVVAKTNEVVTSMNEVVGSMLVALAKATAGTR